MSTHKPCYKLVLLNADRREEEPTIDRLIHQGWVPQGGPIVKNQAIYQAMYRPPVLYVDKPLSVSAKSGDNTQTSVTASGATLGDLARDYDG